MLDNKEKELVHNVEDANLAQLKPEHMFAIKNELEILNGHKLVKTYNSLPRLISLQFVKGMAFGLGSVVGATVVVSLLAYLLSHIEFIPIIGEWTLLLIEEIKQTQHVSE